MKLVDYLRLAFHNITRQKLRSGLTIFAVIIGAVSVTILLTLVFSIKSFITGQFENNGTFQQVLVSPQTDISWNNNNGSPNCSDCVKLTDSLVNQITTVSHVTGVARETHVNGFDGLFYGNQKLRLNQIVAYDANGIIQSTMLAGRDIDSTDGNGVLTISSDYADALGFKSNYQALIGKTVILHAAGYYSGIGSNPIQEYQQMQEWTAAHPNEPGQDFTPAPVEITGKIIGISDASGFGGNSYTVRVPLSWARAMEENQSYQATNNCSPTAPCHSIMGIVTTDELAINGYDSLIVQVDQASNAAATAKVIRDRFKVGAADAQTAIKQQLSIFTIIEIITGGIGGISLFVAAIGVINTMIMATLERTKEIGIMRAVGAKRSTISWLFTFEASLLGCVGGVFGVLIGYALVAIANPLVNHQLQSQGFQVKNIISLPLWLALSVIVGTAFIGMIAGLFPARRASRLNPVEALRYE